MVHAAVGFARMRNRLQAIACTASIGPGSTNMVTGAALATINRLPVLLLPGDVFATRVASPVLQELEDPRSYDVSVNDAFRPVSRFFDRVNRPEQLPSALLARDAGADRPGRDRRGHPRPAAGRAGRGATTGRSSCSRSRVWHVARPVPEPAALARAVALHPSARRPLHRRRRRRASTARRPDALRAFAEATGIPVAETQAGKGALPWDHPQAVGGVGVTGTTAPTRWPARPTSSSASAPATATSPRPRAPPSGRRACGSSTSTSAGFDAAKHAGVAVVADARAGLTALHGGAGRLAGRRRRTRQRIRRARRAAGPRSVDAALRPGPRAAAGPDRGDRRGRRGLADRATSWSARPVACPATCTAVARHATRRATTSSTATPAWATRSPAASASRWPRPTARSSSWSATGPT